MKKPVALAFASILLAAGIPVFAQMGYPRSPRGTSLPSPVPDINKQPKENKQKQAEEPLATFNGTVRSVNSKNLVMEDAESNTLQFECSKKTHYYDGTKKIKPSAVKPGDHVTIEGRRAMDASLEAVNVRMDHRRDAENAEKH